ncbi:MAG TPA: flagellar regulator YcgR PilZN domain-containing protein [Azonexus sp.]|nr:flagellar regulator YcgR PilZN domain-containing protein [Azonexus sp.]
MSQLAQLSAAEIEERFHIVGRRPVAFLLAGFARSGEQFSVQFGDDVFLTTLLAALPEKGRLIIDCSGSPDLNRRFMASRRAVFTGRPGGIHVQFTSGPAAEMLFGGAQAFALDLPEFVLRLQRREAFRIETPRARPLPFFGRLPGGGLLDLPAHDISVAGIGLAGANLPDGISLGLRLPNSRFALPEGEKDLFFSATVRHLTEQASRSGQRQWRVGIQFEDLPAVGQNRIQRYIDKVERERRELS